jgi:cephalosporin hydroxylase
MSPVEKWLRVLMARDSEINEHLETLVQLARKCQTVTEFGVRNGNSTIAFLAAEPRRLVSVDIVDCPIVRELAPFIGTTEFIFRQANSIEIEIEPTDLLFIDSDHCYEHLSRELTLHSPSVAKYIALHDTHPVCGSHEVSMWKAIGELIAAGKFRLKEHYPNNFGLTVLERVCL